MALAALLTGVVLILNTEGVLGAEVRSSIVGGRNAERNHWPWMAHLNISDGVKTWRCGGTILNKWWVLSAASCWKTTPIPYLKKSMIWVGSHELRKASAQYIGVDFVMSHPNYRALSTGGYVNDIAVVKLKSSIKPSTKVKPVSLPSTDDPGSASECWITGWGNIRRDTSLPGLEILQQLKISIIPASDCKATHPELTDGMLCAGDKAGGDACKGDYGGPLVCRSGGGFVQVGIMSYSDCGHPGRPGVYTQVSKYLSYINNYIHGEEASAEM